MNIWVEGFGLRNGCRHFHLTFDTFAGTRTPPPLSLSLFPAKWRICLLWLFFFAQVYIWQSSDRDLGYSLAAFGTRTLTHYSVHKTRRFMTLIYVAWPGVFMWPKTIGSLWYTQSRNEPPSLKVASGLAQAASEGNQCGFRFEKFEHLLWMKVRKRL